MQAAVFHGDRRITVERLPIPGAAPGEVRLRVSRNALCGSDTKLWLKGSSITPGHEILGVVEQKGHALDGRRCVVYIPLHCGSCDACRAGDTQMCLTVSSLIGWNRPGGYAEYLTVPEGCLLPVPDDIEDRLAPLLLDTIGTSAHAVRFASRVVPPEGAGPVLVTGAGPVGLGVVIALQNHGFSQVYTSDPNRDRLTAAVDFGAIPHPAGDASRRFRLIVECSGAHAARNLGLEAVLPRGALMLVGENDAPWSIEETKTIRRKDFHMIRSFYFPKGCFSANVALLRRERERYRRLVDLEFRLRELPEVYRRFAEGGLMKPMLSFA